MKRLLIALAALLACASVPFVPSADAAGATTATYTRHLTYIASGTNAACPVGQHKAFAVTNHLKSGQTFVTVNRYHLRLQNGQTILAKSNYHTATTAQYAFYVTRTAKVDTRLRLSYTTFTANGGASTWTSSVRKLCYSY